MEQSRPSARQRGYTGRWEKARGAFLRAHPNCQMCAEAGRITPATIVDHVVPHRGNQRLFWDTANWQPLCKRHHDAAKQRQERGGQRGVDADGWPSPPVKDLQLSTPGPVKPNRAQCRETTPRGSAAKTADFRHSGADACAKKQGFSDEEAGR